MDELIDILGKDTVELLRAYYRISGQVKIVWMTIKPSRISHVRHSEGIELINFDEFWIPSAHSYLYIAYSIKRRELFIAGELIDDDTDIPESLLPVIMQGLQDYKSGETHDISTLWDDWDEEESL